MSRTPREIILQQELGWRDYPSPYTVEEVISLYTTHSQPLQLFYHALKTYVRTAGVESSPLYGQFLCYYYHYGGTPAGLRTGMHSHGYLQAASLMYTEGYRARLRYCRRFGMIVRSVEIVPPSHVHHIIPEAAACA